MQLASEMYALHEIEKIIFFSLLNKRNIYLKINFSTIVTFMSNLSKEKEVLSFKLIVWTAKFFSI